MSSNGQIYPSRTIHFSKMMRLRLKFLFADRRIVLNDWSIWNNPMDAVVYTYRSEMSISTGIRWTWPGTQAKTRCGRRKSILEKTVDRSCGFATQHTYACSAVCDVIPDTWHLTLLLGYRAEIRFWLWHAVPIVFIYQCMERKGGLMMNDLTMFS